MGRLLILTIIGLVVVCSVCIGVLLYSSQKNQKDDMRRRKTTSNIDVQSAWQNYIPTPLPNRILANPGVYYFAYSQVRPSGNPVTTYSIGQYPFTNIPAENLGPLDGGGIPDETIAGDLLSANEANGKYPCVMVDIPNNQISVYDCSGAPLVLSNTSNTVFTFVRNPEAFGDNAMQSCFTSPWSHIMNYDFWNNGTTLNSACFQGANGSIGDGVLCGYLNGGKINTDNGECVGYLSSLSSSSSSLAADLNSNVNVNQPTPGWIQSVCPYNQQYLQNSLNTQVLQNSDSGNTGPWNESSGLVIGGTVLQDVITALVIFFTI